ncbi:MAG: class I SAM-dependent methyltransferase [Hyphomicrobiaceae bacterium]
MTVMAKLKGTVRDTLPRPALQMVKRALHSGSGAQCVICGAKVRGLLAQGHDYPVLRALDVVGGQRKANDECPICHANDRVRLVYLYVRTETELLTSRSRLLHIAPELGLADIFASTPTLDYVPADLDRQRYRHLENLQSFDLQHSPYPDGSFDWIICNHVLEHIPDDRRAMREMCRMLKPGGAAILQVPLARKLAETREDPTVTDEAERIRLFGQRDHVRLYGIDYYERLRESGFDVTLWNAFDVDAGLAAAWNLNPDERLTIARRRLDQHLNPHSS